MNEYNDTLNKSTQWQEVRTQEAFMMVRWLKKIICKRKGHDWDMYTVSTGYWGNDIEQAGYCLRCGYDTHGEYYN